MNLNLGNLFLQLNENEQLVDVIRPIAIFEG